MADMDLFSRGRKDFSGSSSSSLSPTAPILEAPSVFRVSATKSAAADATIGAKAKLERMIAIPSVFQDDADDEDEDMEMNSKTYRSSGHVKSARANGERSGEDKASQVRALHHEDVLAARPMDNVPRAPVHQDSVIAVEIKINVKIQNDDVLATDLLTRLAHIYQRHESSILVMVQQSTCIYFGERPLPAYFMKIMALPRLIGPVTNLRNTILIQATLQSLLNITADRGVIIYMSVPEENLATNGVTAMGEVRSLERQAQPSDSGFLKSITRSMSKKLRSSGANSKSLSQGTASSWPNPTGSEVAEPPSVEIGSQSGSKGEEPRSVKKSRSVRQFVSRRLSDLGHMSEIH